ncbi:MAG: ribonuclease III [Clostridia bacterium]|nr:ribonuclease III [Clostridia bacterium]
MAIGKSFESLTEVIGYKFSNTEYIENALTHSSYSNEYKSRGLSIPSNERLEFLGDAILEMVISEYLYDNYKSLDEGKLTRIRQHLVCEKTLAGIARKIKLGDYVHLGRGEESDCRTRPKVLADALEAVIAAVYIDSKRVSGSEDYKKVIVNLFSDEFANVSQVGTPDYKTMLQQFVEKDGSAVLEYEVIAEKGPEHKKEFTVIAKVNNNVVGKGSAFNKKDAEMQAAKRALELFGFKT